MSNGSRYLLQKHQDDYTLLGITNFCNLLYIVCVYERCITFSITFLIWQKMSSLIIVNYMHRYHMILRAMISIYSTLTNPTHDIKSMRVPRA
jgi:hypothetical protein